MERRWAVTSHLNDTSFACVSERAPSGWGPTVALLEVKDRSAYR